MSDGTGSYKAPAEIPLDNFMQDPSSEISFTELEFGNKVSYAIVHDSYDDRDHLYG